MLKNMSRSSESMFETLSDNQYQEYLDISQRYGIQENNLKFVLKNAYFCREVTDKYLPRDDIMKENNRLTAKIKELDEVIKNNENLIKIQQVQIEKERESGKTSSNKGTCDELNTFALLQKTFCKDYEIVRDGKIKSMDISMTPKNTKLGVIGVECKDKVKISRNDVEKFREDKKRQNFHRSFFISSVSINTCGVKVNEDETLVLGDEIYICSNDDNFRLSALKAFISQIEINTRIGDMDLAKARSFFVERLKIWRDEKKKYRDKDKNLKLEKEFYKIEDSDGDLYIVSKSQCKGGKAPY